MKTVSVVHLIGRPFNVENLINFISSYKKYGSGYKHEFVILWNGSPNDRKIYVSYLEYADKKLFTGKFFCYPNKGSELDAFHWISDKLKTDYVLFFNSYCEILAENWLLKYMNAITLPNVGIVGATGSFQSYYSTVRQENNFKSLKSAKMWLKNYLLYRFYFKPFPNPHIRTNAFIINRKLFLSLKLPKGEKRIQRYRFESGKSGLSAQLSKKGFNLIVLDKDGVKFTPDFWQVSHTFWNSSQGYLLISDNRTRDYDNADIKLKTHLNYLAWGYKQ